MLDTWRMLESSYLLDPCSSGTRQALKHNDQIQVYEGDVIEISTPGGGEFGLSDVS